MEMHCSFAGDALAKYSDNRGADVLGTSFVALTGVAFTGLREALARLDSVGCM